jgi:hypothetical protein
MMVGMRIATDLRYAASPTEVFAMLLDPAFREAVMAAQHVVRSTITVSEQAGLTVVHLDQTQSTTKVPSFVRKLTGDEITVTQEERWTDPTHAEVTSSIPGAPGTVQGTNDLLADGAGTLMRVVREITVQVPLIGGKLATFVGSMHAKALEKEHATGQAWLSRQ